MASPSDSLKKELLQAQNERGKLMKWKILLISGIGSAALGFSASPALPYAELALCVIPFACAYVDLLCRNLSVRTKLISAFMAKQPDDHENPSPRFEKFYQEFDKERSDALEGLALKYSTWAISVAIVLVGVTVSIVKRPDDGKIIVLFFLAGMLGLFLSWWSERAYQHQVSIMKRVASRQPMTNC